MLSSGLFFGVGASVGGYSVGQKNFAGSPLGGRVGLNIKDDEVTSSEETMKDNRNASSEGKYGKTCDNSFTAFFLETDLKTRLELPIISESPRPNRAPMDIPYLSLFPAENVYESAAKLLFIAIKWARTIPSFLQVTPCAPSKSTDL